MTKRMLQISMIVIFMVLLAGCWSSKEPKNLAMINSAVFDLDDNGGYRRLAEIMNPSGEAGGKAPTGNVSSFTVLTKGAAIPETIRQESRSIDKQVFGGFFQARIFSERMAQSGLTPVLDYFLRAHIADETPLMIVVDDPDPMRIYDCDFGLSSLLGIYLDQLQKNQHKSTCRSVFITMLQFMKDYYDKGKQPVMGLVRIEKVDTAIGEHADKTQSDFGSTAFGI